MPISDRSPIPSPFTPASNRRLDWAELPASVRHGIEGRLGSQVIEASTQIGGFSPGVAARLRLGDGRRFFVKAVSPRPNPDSPRIHRREAKIAASLPATVPSPLFLDAIDDGDWIALLFEDIDGTTPVTPWRRDELDRVLKALTDLTSGLTPAPISVESLSELMPDTFHGWRRLKAAAETGEDDLRGLDPWAQRHLSKLTGLEAASAGAADGTTLVHADIRADNILFTPTRVFFVDWPWASRGAAWIDLLFMLPSVAMQHGPMPWELFDTHPLGRGADPGRVTAVLTALTGFFIRQSRQPPPPGLPTLRRFQLEQGLPALEWLKRRTAW